MRSWSISCKLSLRRTAVSVGRAKRARAEKPRGDWGGSNCYYFSRGFAAHSLALCARFCSFSTYRNLGNTNLSRGWHNGLVCKLRPVHTYPWWFEYGLFSPGGLAYLLHLSVESGHRKRIFSKKALFSGEFWKHELLTYVCFEHEAYFVRDSVVFPSF